MKLCRLGLDKYLFSDDKTTTMDDQEPSPYPECCYQDAPS